ncbi:MULTISPECIES: anthranilate phosphoribosyltransferase [unclassified Agarivorans]|uniref:anthranilate phosphoribosyltransferase n=1 Tax=unclassified Agarivorans TaxID=2636026 RepID=UPI0026E25E44|nr:MULTISPECIES: anthranilate phosphoribosyltransferase [unclassified Agarivorans]MDO6687125.1 anthranilate phosphoribosyltransferase [Agarivorans sp. 3_MG-2023]MDO6713463.1 anthranilate phosphoribosyltransferase [Agarivorans sp. 2_MG-2023]MDO6765278.1 anthranilate phosphoribosyltransferase [Agarivorans sp. 1_MG-2023]
MQAILEQLYQGQNLSTEQAQQVFSQVIQGEVDPIVLSSLLTALKIKGEQPQEIAGAAKALLDNAAPFPSPDYDFADIVGTGGDGHNTINISTTSAFVAASLGVKVAKHGNRSVSSKSGSSDLLAALGINIQMTPETARRCLDELGLCFLFAPQYHAGVRHAMPVRQTLKTRTIFNVLGPLINPAHPTMEVMGVYDPALVSPIALTLQQLGMKKAMVVHGAGLDEVAIHGPTQIAEINGSEISQYTLNPADFGVEQADLAAIKGGTPEENKAITLDLLQGKATAAQQAAVAVNVAMLLKLAGKADSVAQGVQMAIDEMASGRPLTLANQLAEMSQ